MPELPVENKIPEALGLKVNDILIRFADDKNSFNIIYKSPSKFESYTTRSLNGALIIAGCIAEGKEIPADVDGKTKGSKS